MSQALKAADWETTDKHPWVGKPCGVDRPDEDDRVPGIVQEVWRFDELVECVVVDLEDYEQPFVTNVDRVEVL